jgi:ComF family protein
MLRFLNALARCVVCDDPAPGHTLCALCRDSFPSLRWPCPRCALPRRAANAPCGHCLIHSPDWDDAQCAFAYRFPVDYLLKRAKFRGRMAELDALATTTARFFSNRAHSQADVIMPVPLHWRRRWTRGFNQAEELARPVAQAVGLPLDNRSLQRVRATREQSHLHTDERSANLRAAFDCRIPLHGARIILFDDVMTTGATLGAAARALTDQGAAHVRVWTCARTVLR